MSLGWSPIDHFWRIVKRLQFCRYDALGIQQDAGYSCALVQ